MGMIDEFKKFALRGNVLDLAIGVIIGGAFSKITNSLVNDIIMPPLGLVFGRVDFSNRFISLTGKHYDSLVAAKAAGAATLNYGEFINTIIQFLIIAWALFLVIKQINRLTHQPETQKKPVTKDCPYCCTVVPMQAVRCPQCTSELPPAETAA